MKREKWKELEWAKTLLGLGERATMQEIKKAYRNKSKQHHPDLCKQAGRHVHSMQDINRAYGLLLDYCKTFSYPLVANPEEELDDEDWWMDRFGQDPLWGKNSGGS